MNALVAALSMYDWPENRTETDAEWVRISHALRREGIDAPVRLARRNADLPAVSGGILDKEDRLIAPDPATLPPEELDLAALWRHPALLLAQTCWGPMEAGLEAHVQVAGQPDYSAYEGGEGPLYSSAILMRRGEISFSGARLLFSAARPTPSCAERETAWGNSAAFNEGIPAPASGIPNIPLAFLRGKRFAYNEPHSMSGHLALERDLAAMGEDLSIFSQRIETGSHRASALAVAEGKADVCAVDCRTWALIRRFKSASTELTVVGWTMRRPGLPFITSTTTPPEHLAILRRVLGVSP